MAHELGHLFLLPHSGAGLMKADWTSDDYWLAVNRGLLFAADQSQTILEQLKGRIRSN
jgi:hypothetical protein